MCIPAAIISTPVGASNGYALTQFRFPRQRLVFGLMLLGASTPYQAILIPLAKTLGTVDLTGSLTGLSLVHAIYGIPFTTAFARSFFLSLPPDRARAARINGAGFFQIFWRVMLPISLPILVVSVTYQFTNVWKDFLFGAPPTYRKGAPIMLRSTTS